MHDLIERDAATASEEGHGAWRQFLWALAAVAMIALGVNLLALPVAHAQARPELRIGYQKSASLFVLQKAQGSLEARLAPLGFGVKWVEFPAGPQLLEGLNVGAVDVGYVGEAPPIFAQAAGAKFVYIGHDPAAPRAEAILVTRDSPIKSVAELKGRKVALNKGSNVHYLLVRQLAQHGLTLADIQPIYLAPADGRAAFESKNVDAWVIWDPFQAAAEKATGARVLADGTPGIVHNYQYYLGERAFVQKHPKVVQALRRYEFNVKPITREVAADQQQIADTFHALKLIPKPIKVQDAVVFGQH